MKLFLFILMVVGTVTLSFSQEDSIRQKVAVFDEMITEYPWRLDSVGSANNLVFDIGVKSNLLMVSGLVDGKPFVERYRYILTYKKGFYEIEIFENNPNFTKPYWYFKIIDRNNIYIYFSDTKVYFDEGKPEEIKWNQLEGR